MSSEIMERPHTQGRYDPYTRPLPPQHQHRYQRRQMAASPHGSPSTSSSPYPPQAPLPPNETQPSPRTHAKAYETSRPTGKYQPSRGAQRDAKYSQKYAEKAAMVAQLQKQQQQERQQQIQQAERDYYQRQQQQQQQRQHQVYQPHPHTQFEAHFSHLQPSSTSAAPGSALARGQGGRNTHALENWERVRREQQAAIAAARQLHSAEVQAAAKKEEEERKVRRIQLQVFVHARPTHCAWSGCHAVLNSWALLEKHLFHAHLYPHLVLPEIPEQSSAVSCQWDGCTKVFEDRAECYRHALVVHMKLFSARCPFNCLFEGPEFTDLMAHIGRRHPTATPDDFVPGLIHHRPTHVPRMKELPPLPSMSKPWTVHFFGREVNAYSGEIGQRMKKSVHRNCFKGRLPRKECYEVKKGASAAIAAIIENARRLSDIPLHSAVEVTVDGEPEVKSPMAIKGQSLNSAVELEPETARTIVDLVDVIKSAILASEEAKREISKDRDLIVSVLEDSSTGSSPSVSRISTPEPVIKLRPISLIVKRPKNGRADSDDVIVNKWRSHSRSESTHVESGSLSDDIFTGTSTSSSSTRSSACSEFKVARRVVRTTASDVANDSPLASPTTDGVKRSERLRKRAMGTETPAVSPIVTVKGEYSYGAE